ERLRVREGGRLRASARDWRASPAPAAAPAVRAATCCSQGRTARHRAAERSVARAALGDRVVRCPEGSCDLRCLCHLEEGKGQGDQRKGLDKGSFSHGTWRLLGAHNTVGRRVGAIGCAYRYLCFDLYLDLPAWS